MNTSTMLKKSLLPAAIAAIGVVANPAIAGGKGMESAAPVTAISAETLADAVKNGTAKLSFRMRYEDVDIDTVSGKGHNEAITIRSRLNFTTQEYKGFTAFAEVDNVSDIGPDYNDDAHSPAKPGAPIADPTGTEVNQAWLSYKYGGTSAKYGRQRILLDNQRFVGGVGFRQNEQTYDGITLASSMDNLTFKATYVNNVNRIFGEDAEPKNVKDENESSTWLINASYSFNKAAKLTLYSYMLDVTDAGSAVQWMNTDTLGARLTGKYDSFSYQLEYAQQEDADDNPNSYKADYGLAQLNYTGDGFGLLAGYELLGTDQSSDGSVKGFFVTPLATLHKFQGWADVFVLKAKGNLGTGIEDAYVGVSTKIAGIAFKAVYHDFSADDSTGSGVTKIDDLGTEIDLVATYKVNKNLTLQAKYADYNADDFGNDTKKFWLTANVVF